MAGESGWSPESRHCIYLISSERTAIRTPLERLMQRLVDEMLVDGNAWPFIKPVSKDDVPDYYNVITRPMDLSTIEAKVDAGLYADLHDFCADVRLMFSNCRQYNDTSSVYVKCAENLEMFFWGRIRELGSQQSL